MKPTSHFIGLSHPLRLAILKILERKPSTFSDLQQQLGNPSTDLLTTHLHHMKQYTTQDPHGNYILTRSCQRAMLIARVLTNHQWQGRAYLLNVFVYILINAATLLSLAPTNLLIFSLAIYIPTTLWILFYTYWVFVRRKSYNFALPTEPPANID